MIGNAIAGFYGAPLPPSLAAYESIATVNVGSGGVSNIEFTSIPGTFQHLQIRFIAQTNRSTYGVDEFRLQLNSDTGANYSFHRLAGTGASVEANPIEPPNPAIVPFISAPFKILTVL